MNLRVALPFVLFASFYSLAHTASGETSKTATTMASCTFAVENYFVDEVWTKVGAQKCLTCHKQGGDAEDSEFVLRDPQRAIGKEREEALRHNREAFTRMASLKAGNQSRILVKVTGGLDHGGEKVLPADSSGYRVLADFVARVTAPSNNTAPSLADEKQSPPFFDGIAMLDDRRLLRRATLSLAARLPTKDELATIEKEGLKALPGLLDKLMQEEAFYDRVREGFNDIFLTVGITGNPDQVVLGYEYFTKTRGWYSKHDLSHIKDEAERRKAGYKLAADYRESVLAEPMQLVDYIVRNDHPFSEIVTADYMMVSPYSARGYGIYDEIKDRFKDPENPAEFIPVKLKALEGRSKATNQESPTGFYPHAGLLSTFQWLVRNPTTETNRNRLRGRMYYQQFLGVDALELAARVSDAAAVTAKFEIPTMQAAECVVCHKTIDPVAGLFQDYWQFADQSVYGRRKGGWFTDMFAAGFEGEDLPAEERWRSLQWLGERTAKDPRFALAMVEHVYYILTGRKALLPPKAIDEPLYPARQRAYREQRREIDRIAVHFVNSNFNLKQVFKDWVQSDFYRADGIASAVENPCRLTELDDLGLVRMLSPEQVERKIGAVFGERWGKLRDQLAMLYGGIDSKEVTERASDPSGAMGAIQRIMSNDVACKQVARDFGRPLSERVLFPAIEHTVVPGESAEGDAEIRRAIAYLHERILGRNDAVDSDEVSRSFDLFAGVVHDAAETKGLDKAERYNCRQTTPPPPEDKHYTIRAWRAVVTYLLRRQEFLYE
jgi:hypothetical protein